MPCTDTTTCFPCEQNPCEQGCPIELDACCVQYNGENLENINVNDKDTLCEILVKLNDVPYQETNFYANSTNTIIGAPNGLKGHSPFYHVRLNPDPNQGIKVSNLGLFVDKRELLQGKVRVNSFDELDYLENQLSAGTDVENIISVTPVSIGGVIYLVPSINKQNLLEWIKNDLCNLISDCIPPSGTTTTTTSTTSTTSSSTTSSTSTSTTTIAPKNITISNTAGQGTFSVILRDEISLINYINANVLSGNVTNLTYIGSVNESELVIQHGSNVPVKITMSVNGAPFYMEDVYVGSINIPNIPSMSDIIIALQPYAGTTTTSTSTSSTTTSTTTAPECVTVSVTNSSETTKKISYINCSGYPVELNLPSGLSIELCLIGGTLSIPVGVSATTLSTGCNTTTTTSTSTTSTSTTTTSSTTSSTTTTSTTTVTPGEVEVILESSFDATLNQIIGLNGFSLSLPMTGPSTNGGSHTGLTTGTLQFQVSGTTTTFYGVDVYVNDVFVVRKSFDEVPSGTVTYSLSGVTLSPTDKITFNFNNNA